MPLDVAAIIRKMANAYTEAWCFRSAETVASFFEENATSTIGLPGKTRKLSMRWFS